jgi:hypothetical protein
VLVAVAGVLAALSLLAPSQPGYDPWMWLVWGRELATLDLDTVDGPAWKPLPVLLAAPLTAFGEAAPALWLLVARTGAIAAALLAARLAWRLAGRSVLAAAVAGGGVALSAGWAWHAAVGNAEGLLLALAIAAFDRALDGRHRPALALAAAAALLRPETWPFLAAYAAWLWRREPGLVPLAGALAGAVAILWFVPEWLGSGDWLRSAERARIPNPGAPALADRPALASLRRAAEIPLVPVAVAAVGVGLAAAGGGVGRAAAGRGVGLVAGRRRSARPRPAAGSVDARHGAVLAGLPALAGLAWIAIVALMAERGYSGEPRYAVPGAAALAVSGGVGAAWLHARARRRSAAAGAAAAVVALAALVPFVAARAAGTAAELRRAAADARLYGSLDDAVAAAGGRDAVLACGRPVVGRLRGPATAWALRIHRRDVAFAPAAGGVVLRSRIRPGVAVQPPPPPGGAVVARSARWELRRPAGCRY